MDDRVLIIDARVKGLSGMRMDLDPYAMTLAGKIDPELANPGGGNLKATAMGTVLWMDDLADSCRRRPRARPKKLAFVKAPAALAKEVEGLRQ